MSGGIVIVGSGLAGYMLAKEFRKLDASTPLTIISENTAHFYSKPQLSTALTHNKTAEMLSMGDPETMGQSLQASIFPQQTVLQIDREQKKIHTATQQISYDKLVLAVGAEKISPPLNGDAVGEVQSVNHLEEYASFRQWLVGKSHIAILGAGLVGCEFANDLVNAGIKVDVIAPETWPLVRLLPEPVGAVLRTALMDHGVSWHLCEFAESVHRRGAKVLVTTTNAHVVEVDGVFSAIGLRPRVALARAAGLQVNAGIVVNRQLQTSDASIYALGDCAEVDGCVMQYVAPLLQCARTLANILAGTESLVQYPPMPVIIKTPACALSCIPPRKGIVGDWQIEGNAPNIKALFYDKAGQLQGFAVSGDYVKEKLALAKQMPATF